MTCLTFQLAGLSTDPSRCFNYLPRQKGVGGAEILHTAPDENTVKCMTLANVTRQVQYKDLTLPQEQELRSHTSDTEMPSD